MGCIGLTVRVNNQDDQTTTANRGSPPPHGPTPHGPPPHGPHHYGPPPHGPGRF